MNQETNEKQIFVPGEIIVTGMDYLPSEGTFRSGENIVAARVGIGQMAGRAIKVIPLAGKYIPKVNDLVIGKVIDILMSGWRVDINSAYDSVLMLKEATSEFIKKGENLNRYYTFGEYVVTKITNVTSQNLVDITMRGPGLRKITDGRIIEVTPCKVPRIIGKNGSMIGTIKDITKTNIIVGQNGRIWLKSEDPRNEHIVVEAIRKIERESYKSGLTEHIKAYLEERMKGGNNE